MSGQFTVTSGAFVWGRGGESRKEGETEVSETDRERVILDSYKIGSATSSF